MGLALQVELDLSLYISKLEYITQTSLCCLMEEDQYGL